MATRVVLVVNDRPVQLDKFVAGFIENTVVGMAASLKGVAEISSLSLDITGGTVALSVNGGAVTTLAFVSRIIRSTVFGMVATLKGVGEIDRVVINIERIR